MNEQVEKKGMSKGAKWGLGCGVGCLVIVVLVVIAAVIGVKFAMSKLEDMTSELEQYGFEETVKGQAIEVTDEITEPAIYLGQTVKILGDCKTDLAIVAQMAEIHGTVEGKVYFRGQMLTIQPQARLLNGLDVMAQVIQKYGEVQGEITGNYQTMDDKSNQ